jgi:hypothetical protein
MPARIGADGRPVAAGKDLDGSFRIKTVNGNTIVMKEYADGKFSWFKSNNPVDGDMLKLAMPQIREYYRKNPKGK